MLKNFGKKLAVARLNVLKAFLYTVGSPVFVVFFVFGSEFVFAGFAVLCVVAAAFYVALGIFTVNFFMFFVALFNADLWVTMGNMWSWLWGWLSAGCVWLWPYLKQSFLPYMASGAILMLIWQGVEGLNKQLEAVKKAMLPANQ